ncbi:MAG: glycosyltransferase family A protein [Patescibacteria group bacterium]
MVSIIIPVYNQADKLAKCLDSINKQTYRDFEIIIVNDGSVDNLQEVISKYKFNNKSKFIFIEQENKGAQGARNRGLGEVKGDYLLFCDADVILNKNCLNDMMQALKSQKKASYAYSSFYWGRKLFRLWAFDSNKLKVGPYIHTTSLIRKEDFPPEGWDEKIKKLQDWDLWLTMLKAGHIGVWINKPLFKIQTGGTMSSWLPSFVYKLFPILPSVKKYNKAVKIIKEKHGL